MKDQLIREWKLNKLYLFLPSMFAICAGLFGIVLHALILHFDASADSWFTLGSLLALSTSLWSTLMFGCLGYPVEFRLALCFGAKRSEFMLGYALRVIAACLLAFFVVHGLYWFEMHFYPVWFAALRPERIFPFLSSWSFTGAAALILTAAVLFFGSIYAYFGPKGWWISFLMIWVFCGLILPRMFRSELEPDAGTLDRTAFSIRMFFTQLDTKLLFASLAAVVIGMTATFWTLGKHQSVR